TPSATSPLSLHDALQISVQEPGVQLGWPHQPLRILEESFSKRWRRANRRLGRSYQPRLRFLRQVQGSLLCCSTWPAGLRLGGSRSEEHTSELQSRFDLVC